MEPWWEWRGVVGRVRDTKSRLRQLELDYDESPPNVLILILIQDHRPRPSIRTSVVCASESIHEPDCGGKRGEVRRRDLSKNPRIRGCLESMPQ